MSAPRISASHLDTALDAELAQARRDAYDRAHPTKPPVAASREARPPAPPAPPPSGEASASPDRSPQVEKRPEGAPAPTKPPTVLRLPRDHAAAAHFGPPDRF